LDGMGWDWLLHSIHYTLQKSVTGILRYPLQKAWYFDRIYRIYRMLALRYILPILLILSNNF